MSEIFFHKHGFQEDMTLKDCPYCHDSANFTEIAKNPRVVRCNICGLYRLYPRMSRQGQTAMLKKYTDKITDLSYWNAQLDDIDKYTLREVKKIKQIFPRVFQNGRVLDVGCAEGTFALALKQAGANVVGIEPVEKLVELGKEYELDLHVGRFEAGGIPSDLEEHSFDLIIFSGTIMYMPDLRETFDLINPYLRHGGGLYITNPVATSLYFSINKDYSSRVGRYVAGIPTEKALRYMLSQEGYRIHKICYYWPGYVIPVPMWVSKSSVHRVIGKGGRLALSLFAHAIGRGDRIIVYANKIREDMNERK